ncbi:hypothetical protein [Nocardia sp. NPDC058666]|uniref:hypothetical protein n=1 Tax=Nocardia sp. NPDC058666 TaxID=3346587 RepID=UPI00364FE1A2
MPATFAVQNAWQVPMPRTVSFAKIEPIAVSYWVSWGSTLAVLLVPAVVLWLLPVARAIALGYLLTTTTVGAVLCGATVAMAFTGLAAV